MPVLRQSGQRNLSFHSSFMAARPCGDRQTPPCRGGPLDDSERDSHPHDHQHIGAGDRDAEIDVSHHDLGLKLGLLAGHCISPCNLSVLRISRGRREFVPACDSVLALLRPAAELALQPADHLVGLDGIGTVAFHALVRARAFAAGRQRQDQEGPAFGASGSFSLSHSGKI